MSALCGCSSAWPRPDSRNFSTMRAPFSACSAAWRAPTADRLAPHHVATKADFCGEMRAYSAGCDCMAYSDFLSPECP